VVAAGDGSYERLRRILDEQFGDEAHIGLRPLISGSHFLPGAMPQEGQRELYGSVAGALS
jgi:hypothetical protein